MGVLTLAPKPEVFSTVPYLHDVIPELRKKDVAAQVRAVGQLFLKHGVVKDFGLSLVHRHFDMEMLDEILVETIDDQETNSVAVPWKINGSSAKPIPDETWTTSGLPERKLIIPQNWFFNGDGELIPYEYLATDDITMASCLPSLEFAKELYSALKELGVEELIGLRRITHIRHISTWESTPEGVRANITTFGGIPEGVDKEHMLKVVWVFDEDGKLREGSGGWCGVCNNCGSCNRN